MPRMAQPHVRRSSSLSQPASLRMRLPMPGLMLALSSAARGCGPYALADLLQLAFQQRHVLVLFGCQFTAQIFFQPRRKLARQFAEMIAGAAFHFQSDPVQIADAGCFRHLDALEQPVGKQVLLIRRELHHGAVQVRVILLFQLVEVIEFGFVKAFEHGALVGRLGFVARQLIEMERVQLKLHGVADGLEAHGVAQVASGNQLQLAAAHETLAIGNSEPAGQFETALAPPGVTDLRAADLVFFQNRVALRTSGWHVYTLPTVVSCCGASGLRMPRNSSIPLAARLPAPIARITVAAPVTMSPPAKTPGRDVMPLCSSITM